MLPRIQIVARKRLHWPFINHLTHDKVMIDIVLSHNDYAEFYA